MAVINFYMGFTHLKFFCLLSLLGNCSFPQNIIDKEEIFEIAGIKQYIRIKGKDDTKPILLFCMEDQVRGLKYSTTILKVNFEISILK